MCQILWAEVYILKNCTSSKLARLLDTASKFALFSVSGLKDEKLIKKQTYMKTETCKLYSRLFWTFKPNFIKINVYNFELYRFKVGTFFATKCIKHIEILALLCLLRPGLVPDNFLSLPHKPEICYQPISTKMPYSRLLCNISNFFKISCGIETLKFAV